MYFFLHRAAYIRWLLKYNLSVTRADRVFAFILERTFVHRLPPSGQFNNLNPGDIEEDTVGKSVPTL